MLVNAFSYTRVVASAYGPKYLTPHEADSEAEKATFALSAKKEMR